MSPRPLRALLPLPVLPRLRGVCVHPAEGRVLHMPTLSPPCRQEKPRQWPWGGGESHGGSCSPPRPRAPRFLPFEAPFLSPHKDQRSHLMMALPPVRPSDCSVVLCKAALPVTSSLMYTHIGLASHGCSRHSLQDEGERHGLPGTPRTGAPRRRRPELWTHGPRRLPLASRRRAQGGHRAAGPAAPAASWTSRRSSSTVPGPQRGEPQGAVTWAFAWGNPPARSLVPAGPAPAQGTKPLSGP